MGLCDLGEQASHAKVCKFVLAWLAKQYVLWLDVQVDDVLAMDLVEADQDVSDDLSELCFWYASIWVRGRAHLDVGVRLMLGILSHLISNPFLLSLRLMLDLPQALLAQFHNYMNSLVLNPTVEISNDVWALSANT